MAGGSNTFGGTIKLQGESEYRRALAQINQSLKETSSVMKTVTSAYDQNDNSTKKLKDQIGVLNKQLGDQKSKMELMNSQYSKMAKAVSESANKHSELVSNYEKEKAKLDNLKSSVGTTSSEYQKQEKIVDSLGKEVEESTKAQEDNEKAMSKMRVQINNAQTDINKTEKEIEGLNKEMKESPSVASKFGEGLKKAGGVALSACKGIAVSVGAIATSLVAVVGASVKARGDLEQSIGGIETLFKDSADAVIENANRAYKTSGLSANEYMQTATSFSASLLQGLAGDTQKAADITDMAMTDMSDNANKMGTDMSSIQNAYQGFAKQNYTMLDNLKLGYGGTKKEMERLLADAEKISGVHYDISNLSDVYSAIHVIQGELGITGTTAKEAQETLTGSISMVKASWDNFLSGSGDLGQLVESARYAVTNILRLVTEALPEIINQIVQFAPELIKVAGELINGFAESLSTNYGSLLESASEILITLIDRNCYRTSSISSRGHSDSWLNCYNDFTKFAKGS